MDFNVSLDVDVTGYSGKFGHDRPEAPSDYEYRREYPEYGIVVYVSKVGGGRLGKSYEGFWHYLVLPLPTPYLVLPLSSLCACACAHETKPLFWGSDLRTGAVPHAAAAEDVADYYLMLTTEPSEK